MIGMWTPGGPNQWFRGAFWFMAGPGSIGMMRAGAGAGHPRRAPYSPSLLKIDTVTFQPPSGWRFRILTNLPFSVGFAPSTANLPIS